MNAEIGVYNDLQVPTDKEICDPLAKFMGIQ
jgi:hypothetical protein